MSLLAAALAAGIAQAAPISWKSLQLQPVMGGAAPALDGEVVLVVNVASQCGYTGQYDGLQKLYSEKKGQGFAIVGVPCNQFGGQEPGSAQEIQSFCKLNYGVDFPILAKAEVNGAGRSPLYQQLVGSSVGAGKDIKWNFEKFLISRSGEVVGRYPSSVKPEDATLRADIERELKKARP